MATTPIQREAVQQRGRMAANLRVRGGLVVTLGFVAGVSMVGIGLSQPRPSSMPTDAAGAFQSRVLRGADRDIGLLDRAAVSLAGIGLSQPRPSSVPTDAAGAFQSRVLRGAGRDIGLLDR